ncbi:MAG: tetratricopeptide repeat protein [Phycisphaeraceae bacterium]|nr:tetratricopeptide repeat protein [Phycisphaeraceae bacterium]
MRPKTPARLIASTCLTLALLSGTLLSGCATSRPLPYVREQGDKAMDRQNYTLAKAEFEEVVQRDPTDWRSRSKLASVYEQLGQYPQMREQMAVAYDLRPEDPEILDLYCESMRLSQDNDALIRFLRDLSVSPGRVEDFLRLGYYASQVGDVDEAERALLTGARLDRGQSVEPQMALATFFAKLGDDEHALQRLRMALFLDPENESIKEAIRSYGEIPGPSYAVVPTESRLDVH